MEDIFYSKELPMELIKKMKSQVKDRMIGIKISSKSQTDQCVYFSPNASEELFIIFILEKSIQEIWMNLWRDWQDML